MSGGTFFKAPWSMSLILTTSVSCLFLLGIAVYFAVSSDGRLDVWKSMRIGIPVSIVLIASLFSVRGYMVLGDRLYIQRIGWKSTVELEGLVDVRVDSTAMENSVRTFGNGGLFSISGNFRNKKLGPYKAYATDPNRAVILQYSQQAIVLTPDNPQLLLEEINESFSENNS